MIDETGRNIDYIRISVTDRCNLRCIYCMPEEGIELLRHEDILTYDEIVRLCRVLARLGFTRVKLTGGEPFARKGLTGLVRGIKTVPGIQKVTVTTNGTTLSTCMQELADAGIDGINISLDTVDPAVYAAITRRDAFPLVQSGIRAALRYPQIPIKINCVLLGRKDQDLMAVAALAREHPIHVRFIEIMPIGYGSSYPVLTEEHILDALRETYGSLTAYGGRLGNGPAHYYTIDGFQGKLGFISAISHKFCENCNRVRLTAQGYLKTCLQYGKGRDLRAVLRGGGTDEDLTEAIRQAILEKPLGHQFGRGHLLDGEEHAMSQIGG